MKENKTTYVASMMASIGTVSSCREAVLVGSQTCFRAFHGDIANGLTRQDDKTKLYINRLNLWFLDDNFNEKNKWPIQSKREIARMDVVARNCVNGKLAHHRPVRPDYFSF